MLENAHVVLRRGAAGIVLAGVTDRSAPAHGQPGPNLEAALAGAPDGAPVVLLDHQPRGAERAAARGVALQLSGHTHGGMNVVFDRLVANGNGGFVSGRYAVEGMTLYVSNGTALWPGLALRLGRSSEMTRVTLHGADQSAFQHAIQPDGESALAAGYLLQLGKQRLARAWLGGVKPVMTGQTCGSDGPRRCSR